MNYQNPQLLTTPAALHARLGDPNLRLLDATVFLVPAQTGYRAESGLAKYAEGHIPGAAFMDLIQAFSDTTTGLGFSLPGADALAAALGALGVSREHEVVLYSSGHMMWATRAWWLLRYCGHERLSVLNGGLARWRAEGLPLATAATSYPPCSYAAAPRPEMFAGAKDVLAAMGVPGTCTINALSPEVYAGTGAMHYGRRGHIPGSLNLHYDELLNAEGFRSADELHAALTSRGLLTADRIIAYCGGGISATIDGFACLLAGQERVAVYDGSMSEWVRDQTLPLVTGAEPGAAPA